MGVRRPVTKWRAAWISLRRSRVACAPRFHTARTSVQPLWMSVASSAQTMASQRLPPRSATVSICHAALALRAACGWLSRCARFKGSWRGLGPGFAAHGHLPLHGGQGAAGNTAPASGDAARGQLAVDLIRFAHPAGSLRLSIPNFITIWDSLTTYLTLIRR